MSEIEIYKNKYKLLLPELPERSRRLVVAADAKSRGHGGVMFVHKTSGISRVTITKGIKELEDGVTLPEERSRQPGGGRKKITETDPTLENDLLDLVEDSSQGDPESLLKWTNKSLRTLSKELEKKNHTVSHTKAGHILKANDYHLQSNKKSKEGTDHPDRDEQFQYISAQAA
ncbi:ISAzo13 family transposase, partial [Patescibacteria group bacterium AH-259-L07]|nr:ISAzo13 family transposase [Patescibacteria group bacterium AH-259-L07]